MAMAPDTLSISKELRAAGFSEEQADVLATQIAAQPEDVVTRQDLALALAAIERRMDHLDEKIDRVESRLVIKLGAIMAGGFGLILTAIAIAAGVIIGQIG